MAVEQGEGLVSFALYTELLRALAHAGQAQKALHILRDYEHKLQGGKVRQSVSLTRGLWYRRKFISGVLSF